MGQPTTAISGFSDTSGDFRGRLLTGVREWASNAVNYGARNMLLLPAEWNGARYAVCGHDGTPFASPEEIREKGLMFLGTSREGGALSGAGLKLAAARLSFPDIELVVGSRIGGKFHAGRGYYSKANSMWEVEGMSEKWEAKLRTLFGAEFDQFNVFYAMRVNGSDKNLFTVKTMSDLPFMCDFIGRPGRSGAQRGGPLTLRYHTYEDIADGETRPSKGSFCATILAPREEYHERFRGDDMTFVVHPKPFDFEVQSGLEVRVERSKVTFAGFPTKPSGSPTGEHHVHSIRDGVEFDFKNGSAASAVLMYKVRGFASFVATDEKTSRFADNAVYFTDRPGHFLSSLGLPSTDCGPSGPFITAEIDIQEVKLMEGGNKAIDVDPLMIAAALGYRPDFTFTNKDATRKLLLAACDNVRPEDLADAKKRLWDMWPAQDLSDLPDLGGGGDVPRTKRQPVLEAWDIVRGAPLSEAESGDEILALVWDVERDRPVRCDDLRATARCSASVEIERFSRRAIGLVKGAKAGLTKALKSLKDRGMRTDRPGTIPLVSLRISQMGTLSDDGILTAGYEVGNRQCVPTRSIDVIADGGRQRLLTITDVPVRQKPPGEVPPGGGRGPGIFRPFKERPQWIFGTLGRNDKWLFLNHKNARVAGAFPATTDRAALEQMRLLYDHMNNAAIGLRDAKLHDTPLPDEMPEGTPYDDYVDYALNLQLGRFFSDDRFVEELVEKIEKAVGRFGRPKEGTPNQTPTAVSYANPRTAAPPAESPKSRHPGVYWHKTKRYWYTYLTKKDKVKLYLRTWPKDEEDAAGQAVRRAKAVLDAGGTDGEAKAAARS